MVLASLGEDEERVAGPQSAEMTLSLGGRRTSPASCSIPRVAPSPGSAGGLPGGALQRGGGLHGCRGQVLAVHDGGWPGGRGVRHPEGGRPWRTWRAGPRGRRPPGTEGLVVTTRRVATDRSLVVRVLDPGGRMVAGLQVTAAEGDTVFVCSGPRHGRAAFLELRGLAQELLGSFPAGADLGLAPHPDGRPRRTADRVASGRECRHACGWSPNTAGRPDGAEVEDRGGTGESSARPRERTASAASGSIPRTRGPSRSRPSPWIGEATASPPAARASARPTARWRSGSPRPPIADRPGPARRTHSSVVAQASEGRGRAPRMRPGWKSRWSPGQGLGEAGGRAAQQGSIAVPSTRAPPARPAGSPRAEGLLQHRVPAAREVAGARRTTIEREGRDLDVRVSTGAGGLLRGSPPG